MPPRYAYWTILLGTEPTSFRSGSQEELLPTLNRLKQKHPEARMMWWQNGQLWPSRLDAQEAMRARGEMGRARDFRQRETLSERKPPRRDGFSESKGFRDRDRGPRPERKPSDKLDWKPKGEGPPRTEWRPKTAALAPRDHLVRRSLRDGAKPEWKPKGESRARSEWKPKSESRARSEWKPKSETRPRTEWKPKTDWKPKPRSEGRAPSGKLDWKPKGAPAAPKRAWVPKEEYKKSQGIEARRDKNWRPGGEHKDPRQKYKDAKKAKWSRFKQNIRAKWETKQAAPKKRRDKE